ncbi:hypothetical protein ACLI09_11295 [Flavobacterium sp. RHBU_24]|uniref:hypothetical protein n=1 Tax=Flavobacterium sp. RHBU_24 TaxID=3391185 RepID=UPI003984EC64
MKYIKHFIIALSALLLQGCWGWGYSNDDDFSGPQQQQNFKAVTMKRSQLESSIALKPAKAVTDAGKIYIKNNTMYVTEVNKGFHVFNYTNPENPVAVAYIEVPGATDLAIRDNSLYINQAVDLVTLNYTGNAVTVTGRVRAVFPQKQAPDDSYESLGEDEIIINWIPK